MAFFKVWLNCCSQANKNLHVLRALESDINWGAKTMLPSETGKHDFTRVEVFSCLSDQELAMMRERCATCVFSTGNIIVERDEQDQSVYFIMYGRVHVLNYSNAGRIVTYASIAEGGMFGEMAAIDGLA